MGPKTLKLLIIQYKNDFYYILEVKSTLHKICMVGYLCHGLIKSRWLLPISIVAGLICSVNITNSKAVFEMHSDHHHFIADLISK